MIQLDNIRGYFPEHYRNNRLFDRYMLKEFIQLLILDYLVKTPWYRKMTFIGGTCLRLTKGIDRFSEDLDFDCKDFSQDDFLAMTNDVLRMLQRFGLKVEARDKTSSLLVTFRRSIHFPGLLFDIGLSGYRNERFLIKIEAQDQGIEYDTAIKTVKGCGFLFHVRVPADAVLCAMKVAAVLNRTKGRDLYDLMFLLPFSPPDYQFLQLRCGIGDAGTLRIAMNTLIEKTDLRMKMKDFEHLLMVPDQNLKVLRFQEFIETHL